MLRWICGNTRRDRFQNDDIRERLGVAQVEEAFVQHPLRWFRHIQWRPAEALVHSGVIRQTANERSGKERPNLTWEESVKRFEELEYHQGELALDRREWKLAIHMPEP
jgi:hypothetical protein